MKKIFLLITLLFTCLTYAQSNSIDCDYDLYPDEEFNQLTSDIQNIFQAQNSCDEIPIEDRKLESSPNISRAQILAEMAQGCFIGLFKGFINGLKDIITGIWDLLKLGTQLAKKFGSKIIKYLEIAYHGGIATLFSEYARDAQDFMQTILNGLKSIPNLILNAAENELAHFQCLNSGAKADYVCKSISYIGTDVLVAVLTGGATKAGYLTKVQDAVSLGIQAQKAKYFTRADKLVGVVYEGAEATNFLRKSFRRFNPKKVDRIILRADKRATFLKNKYFKIDDELNDLIAQFSKIPKTNKAQRLRMKAIIKAKALELEKAAKVLSTHNTKLSHLRSQKLIYELEKSGMIEVKKIVADGKSLNLEDLKKGRYPPWSEGGPVYEVKVKNKVELCRGGSRKEINEGVGRWFLPCALNRLRTKEDNRWVNATADNPYDIFAKYALREGDTIQIGGINPILNRFGKQRVFTDKNSGRISRVRGGGGEVQVFRPSRDKLTNSDLVEQVNVYDDPIIRSQQRVLRTTDSKDELLRIRSEVSKRKDDLEAEAFLRDIDEKLRTLN